jgi:hypothetical protein
MAKGTVGEALGSILSAGRKLTASPLTILVALLIYLLMLGAIFLFLTTRESSLGQILLGLVVSPLLAVLLFFIGQAFALQATRTGIETSYKLRRAIIDCSKIIIATLPLIGIMVLTLYLFNQAEIRIEMQGGARWMEGLPWLKALLFAVIFPLLAIHTWILAVRDGAANAVRSVSRIFRQAFNPGSVLIYLVTAGTYGVLAWLLFQIRPRIDREWLELSLFAVRMGLALLTIFLGWLLLLGGMAEWTARRELGE